MAAISPVVPHTHAHIMAAEVSARQPQQVPECDTNNKASETSRCLSAREERGAWRRERARAEFHLIRFETYLEHYLRRSKVGGGHDSASATRFGRRGPAKWLPPLNSVRKVPSGQSRRSRRGVRLALLHSASRAAPLGRRCGSLHLFLGSIFFANSPATGCARDLLDERGHLSIRSLGLGLGLSLSLGRKQQQRSQRRRRELVFARRARPTKPITDLKIAPPPLTAVARAEA